jgi:hypothetical protein
MYLFTRSVQISLGHLQESAAWSLELTEKVNQVTALGVGLWTPAFSPGLGSLVWAAVVEDLTALEASDAKLMADPDYVSLLERGGKFAADHPIDDALWQLVHDDPNAASAQPRYVNVIRAVLAPGHAVKGVSLGVEIAQRSKAITGRPTSFAVAETGPYGGVEWMVLADSAEQVQEAQAALGADTDFAQLVDRANGTAYQAGATQALYRRVA